MLKRVFCFFLGEDAARTVFLLSCAHRLKCVSTASSNAFLSKLNQLQPKNDLTDSEEKVHALVWYYTPEDGLGFHGMWAGEIDGKHVTCIRNNLMDPLYSAMLPDVIKEVEELPEELLTEMGKLWFGGRPYNECVSTFAAKQLVKHVVQEEKITIDAYWETATEFAKIFTNQEVDMMIRHNTDNETFYPSESLQDALSQIYGKAVRVTFIKHEKYGIVPHKVMALMDNNYNRMDHVNIWCNYPSFRF